MKLAEKRASAFSDRFARVKLQHSERTADAVAVYIQKHQVEWMNADPFMDADTKRKNRQRDNEIPLDETR